MVEPFVFGRHLIFRSLDLLTVGARSANTRMHARTKWLPVKGVVIHLLHDVNCILLIISVTGYEVVCNVVVVAEGVYYGL